MCRDRAIWIVAIFLVLFAGCDSSDTAKDDNALDGDQVAADGDNTGQDGDEPASDGDSSQEDGDVDNVQPDGDEDVENDEPIPSVAYPVVDTGQATCYGIESAIDCPAEGMAFAGQDAQHLGREMSNKDNGDGTVTDLVTGLMWQKSPTNQSFGWEQALSYCDSLSLAGLDDWRAPSLKELFAISDFSTGWPYIDQKYFDLVQTESVSKDEQYWTSNFYEVGTTHGGQDTAFGVNHGTGHIKGYPSAAGGPVGGNYIRCVRGETYGINQFVNNGDGTITDAATGLIWMQDDSSEGLDWQHALAYCENLSLAEENDWRLPDVKELQSIVDYSGTFPAIDPMFKVAEITNEGGNADYPYFWSSTSAYFNPSDPGYYYAWYVAFGYAVGPDGEDTHGAGAARFDTKVEGGPEGEGGERVYNYVRCARAGGGAINYDPPVDGDVTPDGDDPVVDGDGPPVDGDEPVGPTSCTSNADCQQAGACPADAVLGCVCTTMPDGDFCIPSCTTDDDCPTIPGLTLTCGPQSTCMPGGGSSQQ